MVGATEKTPELKIAVMSALSMYIYYQVCMFGETKIPTDIECYRYTLED